MSTAMPIDEPGRRTVAGAAAYENGPLAASAVSWGAIFAGAAAAAVLSLILLVLGTGLGLSSASPWPDSGIGGGALTLSAIAWLTFTQIAASGLGGYLAGRLRTRWSAVHSDEVYFRDTAHGFLAWAIASLVSAAVLGSVVGGIVSEGVQAGGAMAGGVAKTAITAGAAGGAIAARGEARGAAADEGGPFGYFVDSLFRRDPNSGAGARTTADGIGTGASGRASEAGEVSRIFMNSFASGRLPEDDTRYIAQLVAERTGLSQDDAEKRVSDTFGRTQAKLKEMEGSAREAADKARKASAYGALWLFVTMLIGAFSASFMATHGGRRRDLQP